MTHYEKIGAIIRKSLPLEKKPRFTEEQIERFKSASAVALALIGVAGVVLLSAVAPNIFIAIDKLFLKKRYPHHKFSKREKDRKLADIFYYMKRSGQIKMKLTGKDILVSLSKRGWRRLEKLNFEAIQIPRPKIWDGNWWQVAADIPTKKYKRGADLLRQKLKDMKFYPLQRTLWFHPFDPRKEIEYIANYYNIGQFVTVMEINRLDKQDEDLLKDFFQKEKIIP